MSTVPAPRPSLASFWHDLPREGKLLLSVVVFEFLGTGLVLPFHVVYLHEVRGFALSDVGLLLALPPLVGFLAVGPGGSAIDRFGARSMILGALTLLVCGDVVLAFADSLAQAGLGLTFSGIAFGVSWPASQSLIAAVVPTELRQRYFGVNFTLLNLGIGLGGILGGIVVDVDRPETFQGIYLFDALSYPPPPAAAPPRRPSRRRRRPAAGRPSPPRAAAGGRGPPPPPPPRPAVAGVLARGFAPSVGGSAQGTAGGPV